MKRIQIILAFITAAFAAQAQGVDSTNLLQKVTVSKSVHTHALRCVGLSNMSSPERINYINDLAASGYNTKVDTAKITVNIPAGLIVDVYRAGTVRAEGVIRADNDAAEAELFSQVQGNNWIVSQIIQIKTANAITNNSEKEAVKDFMLRIKP